MADCALLVASSTAAWAVVGKCAIVVTVRARVIGIIATGAAPERGACVFLRDIALPMPCTVVSAESVAVATLIAKPTEVAVGAPRVYLANVATIPAGAPVACAHVVCRAV